MKATTSRTANFGPYTLDLRSGEMRKFGTKIKMGEQSFRILCMLLETPGEMVTREELRAKLWADDTFVDFDHGLNSAVQRLRDCLSDSAGKPLWVETLPRRGYRFIGEVRWSDGGIDDLPDFNGVIRNGVSRTEGPSPSPMSPPNGLAKEGARAKSRRTFVFLGAAILVFAAALPVAKAIRDLRLKREARLIRSIAVLPLENFSSDPGQEFFADGMTDELITMLAKNPSLRVTSRTSVMQYKKAHRPLRDIAQELGVDGILEGSVGREGNRVHVTAQLIYAPTDTHVWAESYDRDVDDVNSLQSEVAKAIARQVGLTSSVSENAERPIKAEAHDAYLLGRYHWFAFDTEKAKEQFQKAIDLQPDYAAAWSGLADSLTLKAVDGEIDPAAVMPQAEEAAKKSLALDDSLTEAHNAMAAVNFFYKWDWNGAERESARAIELRPGLAEPHHLREKILNSINRSDEAVQEQKKAMELDPFARPWAMALALVAARQFDAALQDAHVRKDANPNDPRIRWILSVAYRFKGMEKESVQEWEKMLELKGHSDEAAELRRGFEREGYRGALEWNLAGYKKQAKDNYVSPFAFAEAYAMLGRRDETLRYLEKSYEERGAGMAELQSHPVFDFLHADSRYRAIVKKMRLPPAYE